MTILNQANNGNLSLLVALWRALRLLGPTRKERLLSLCAPSEAIDDKQGKASKTLNAWVHVGMFVVTDKDEIALAEEFRKVESGDIDGLRRGVLNCVIEAERAADEAASGDGPAKDFADLSAWALMQDPYTFVSSWEQVEQLHKTQGPRLMNRREQWNGFVAWAPFLGVAARATQSKFVLNPAFAIRGVLPAVFKEVESRTTEGLHAPRFLRRVAALLPFLDHGSMWESVMQKVSSPWIDLKESEVSPCVALALLQLEHEGEIRLRDRSDAPDPRMLLGHGGRPKRRVSHVVLGGADG